jgi:hypothetical protein
MPQVRILPGALDIIAAQSVFLRHAESAPCGLRAGCVRRVAPYGGIRVRGWTRRVRLGAGVTVASGPTHRAVRLPADGKNPGRISVPAIPHDPDRERCLAGSKPPRTTAQQRNRTAQTLCHRLRGCSAATRRPMPSAIMKVPNAAQDALPDARGRRIGVAPDCGRAPRSTPRRGPTTAAAVATISRHTTRPGIRKSPTPRKG